MINAYALSKARYLVDKCGTKEILINNELFAKYCSDVEIFKILPNLSEILGDLHDANSVPIAPFVCILWALYEKDIVDEQAIKTPEEYFRLMFTHEDAAKKIEFFYNNFNENRHDNE